MVKLAEGVTLPDYKRRVTNGWSKKDASQTPVNRYGKYNKWLKLAEQNKINNSTFHGRINKLGWEPEDAATIPNQSRKDAQWIKLAESNGIHRNTYIDRVDNRFWSEEDAATIPPKSKYQTSKIANQAKSEYQEVINNRIFNDENNMFTLTPKHFDIARKNNISESAVKSRVYVLGWTVQDAIATEVNKVDFERPKEYHKYLEIAKENNISNGTYYNRVRSGMAPEDAATKELVNPSDLLTHDEEWMKLALNNGIKAHTYRTRVNKGWTPKEAATTRILKPGEFLNEERREKALKGFKMFKGVKEDDST